MVYVNNINYEFLAEKALKNVVKDALKIVEAQGFPADHHFYITFKTNHPATKVSPLLKSQYPEEMTIVVQHQYEDLRVDDIGFTITLHFGGIPQKLEIPFDAISYFADPAAKFGLAFGTDSDGASSTAEAAKKVSNEPAEVVSIADFRKKKNK